jgi:hypothetical protein
MSTDIIVRSVAALLFLAVLGLLLIRRKRSAGAGPR